MGGRKMNFERHNTVQRDLRERDVNSGMRLGRDHMCLTSRALCGGCGHAALMHVNNHGGCWQPMGKNKVCVCKGYVVK